MPRGPTVQLRTRSLTAAAAPLRRAGFRCGLAGGAAGSVLVAVGGVLVGPQAVPHGPAGTIAGYAASYGGLVLLVAAWLHIGRLLRHHPGPGDGALRVLLLAWCLPLVVAPPLFSRDIFSYAAHGREIALGINPYHHGPAALGGGPYLRFVPGAWARAPSPYGPLFLGLDGALVGHVGQHASVAVAGLRLLSLAGVVLLAVWLPRLAAACGTEPSLATWLGVLNPLVLLHVVSGGHNDGLMLGLLVAGLTMARRERFVAALLLCLLAAAVKAPAGLGVAYVGADWVRSRPDRRRMVSTAVRAGAIIAATATSLTSVSGLGWGWLSTLATPTRARSLLSPMTDVGLAAAKVAHRLRLASGGGWAVSLAQITGLALATVICGAALAGRARWGSITSLGVSLLAVVVLAPVFQPWYLLWGMVLMAAAGPGQLRPLLTWTSAGLSLLVLPNGGAATDAVTLGFLATVVAVAVLSAQEGARRRDRLSTA
jgi:hypothetical protein